MHELHNDLPFLPERIKIEKVKKVVTNLHVKTEYVIHIRNLNQALNHGLLLKNVQMYYIKTKKQKKILRKYFFKLMNNAFYGKTMENVRKHRNIKLVTTERIYYEIYYEKFIRK